LAEDKIEGSGHTGKIKVGDDGNKNTGPKTPESTTCVPAHRIGSGLFFLGIVTLLDEPDNEEDSSKNTPSIK